MVQLRERAIVKITHHCRGSSSDFSFSFFSVFTIFVMYNVTHGTTDCCHPQNLNTILAELRMPA
jgi:hypothetical protein